MSPGFPWGAWFHTDRYMWDVRWMQWYWYAGTVFFLSTSISVNDSHQCSTLIFVLMLTLSEKLIRMTHWKFGTKHIGSVGHKDTCTGIFNMSSVCGILGYVTGVFKQLGNKQQLTWIVLVASTKLRKAPFSFVVSVCPSAWNNSTLNARIIMKFYIWVFLFLENLSVKFKFDKKWQA